MYRGLDPDKKTASRLIFSQVCPKSNTFLSRQIGSNLMTKLTLLNDEKMPLSSVDLHFRPDPVWTKIKRKTATLASSIANLLKIKHDAIYNSFHKTGIRLPVDHFRHRLNTFLRKNVSRIFDRNFLFWRKFWFFLTKKFFFWH